MPGSKASWDIVPPSPPVLEDYQKAHRAFVSSLAGNLMTGAPPSLPGEAPETLLSELFGGGHPPDMIGRLFNPYAVYLEDYTHYVNMMQHTKDRLHSDAVFNKAVKQAYSYDLKGGPETFRGTPSFKADFLDRLKGNPMTVANPIVTARHVQMHQRKKNAPSTPKPELVEGKKLLRAAKVKAKAEKLKTAAQAISERPAVAASRVRAGLTYAKALAADREKHATTAAKLAADTVQARSYLRKERTEAKRVPLYARNGGNAALPDEPAGDFLVSRDASTRVRVVATTTTNAENSTKKIVEKFTKDST